MEVTGGETDNDHLQALHTGDIPSPILPTI
jgi:hypothetical protein